QQCQVSGVRCRVESGARDVPQQFRVRTDPDSLKIVVRTGLLRAEDVPRSVFFRPSEACRAILRFALQRLGTSPKTFASYTGMNEPVPPSTERRSFLTVLAAAIISVVLGVVPFGAGVAMFLDPLRRKSNLKGAIKVAALDAVPADGVPRKFPVVA